MPMENNESKIDTKGFESPMMNNAHKTQAGPIVGSIIIIIIIIFGGLYFLGKKASEEGVFAPTAEEIKALPDANLQSLESQGASDELPTIEEDLNATSLEGLDTELQSIESEFNF